jgi:hypothetical protein
MSRKPHPEPLTPLQVQLTPSELATLDAIQAEISRRGKQPTRVGAVRWALRELGRRVGHDFLDGPMTEP